MSNPPNDSSGRSSWGEDSEPTRHEGSTQGKPDAHGTEPQSQPGQFGADQYGQNQYGGHGQYGQNQYGQDQYGQQYGQGQYGQQYGGPNQYGQNPQYGQGQYGQNQYGQNQYGQQGQPYGQQQGWNQQGGYQQGGYPGGPNPPKKKSSLPLIIGAAVLALVLLGGAIFLLTRPKQETITPAPTSTSSAARQPSSPANRPSSGSSAGGEMTTGTLGQPTEFTSRTGSGTWTVKQYKWQKDGLVAPQNGAYLVLDIEIQCTEGTYNYGSLYFKGKTDDGREYTMGFGDRGNTPKLGVGTLKAGDKTRGYLALDVPQGEVKLVMTDLLNDISSVKVPGN